MNLRINWTFEILTRNDSTFFMLYFRCMITFLIYAKLLLKNQNGMNHDIEVFRIYQGFSSDMYCTMNLEMIEDSKHRSNLTIGNMKTKNRKVRFFIFEIEKIQNLMKIFRISGQKFFLFCWFKSVGKNQKKKHFYFFHECLHIFWPLFEKSQKKYYENFCQIKTKIFYL
jgi:hypothetical protein